MPIQKSVIFLQKIQERNRGHINFYFHLQPALYTDIIEDRVCVGRTHRISLTLSYTGGGGGWIPPLLTLVLNSVSGIQAIVLMFGDSS